MLRKLLILALASGSSQSFSQIKINEFMTGGKEKASEEFIELYNPTDIAINLKGWKILYRSSAGKNETELFTWKGDFLLKPKDFFIAASEEFPGKKNGKLKDNLSGTSGAIGLRDSKDSLRESVAYGKVNADNIFIEKSACDAPNKATSMSRLPDGKDTDDNSLDFVNTKTPTPGDLNTSTVTSTATIENNDGVEFIQSSQSVISVNFKDASPNNEIGIFNNFGVLLSSHKTTDLTVDLSAYGPGMYFIYVLNNDKKIIKKVIVN
ncbi:MAG TPA: lamin tail domain-containing protein [Cytophagaceae bacterium]|jgi:hypothetical protein